MLFLAAVGLLLAGGVVLYKTRPPAGNTDKELVSVGQGFVRGAIRGELKTTFSGDEETHIERLPDRKFLVAGWVDIMAEDGSTERRTFSCVIYKTDSDLWAGENVAVLPQQL
ncbi:MAG: hypothetical protein JWP63_27 [Candidatus Solibacter sp.]|jgi:hypothetical protein|nr:hypothetical protein [Candidatus Solibacter sp.]